MKYEEKRMNLFEVDKRYALAHCISSDIKMGSGIAVDFQKKYSLRNVLLANYDESQRKHPTCIFERNVFNLITKSKYWGKPTYDTITVSIQMMKDQAVQQGIKYIAMPKIGCGLDRLSWGKVREIIQETFQDTDIEILVCYM